MSGDEALLEPTRVYKFGRYGDLHSWRVTVVGDDRVGYRCQVETHCGRVVDDTAENVLGFVSCKPCDDRHANPPRSTSDVGGGLSAAEEEEA